MKKIPLSQGKFALVDDEDYEWLNQWKWSAHKPKYSEIFYSFRSIGAGKYKREMIKLHVEILKHYNLYKRGMIVDHINRDGLDNRKNNLRMCTRAQNMQNSKLPKNNTSGYKGVYWNNQIRKWHAKIMSNRMVKHLGFFTNSKDAAKAYDEAAKKYHGEFARTNMDEGLL